MRLLAYVSESDGKTSEVQLCEMRAYADSNGHEIASVVFSDTQEQSVDLPRILGLLTDVDGLIVAKLDCFAGSLKQGLEAADELAKLNKVLIVTDLALETSTPAGRCVLTLSMAFAELRREIANEEAARLKPD